MKKLGPAIAALAVGGALIAAPLYAQDKGKDWNFGDGVTPERWSLVNGDYAMCDAGLAQSPIDLGSANARAHVEFDTAFGTANGVMAVSEEKVQVDFPRESNREMLGMMSGQTAFNLLQVHFHTPSEHAIDGKRYPLVAHFVHATDDGRLGVLGVMFAEGAANPELQKIVDGAAAGSGAAVALDLDPLVPDDLHVYRYMGSLTTPPCSEGVNWHVADRPLTASASQIAAMEAALGPSARSIQPTGNRLVTEPIR
ncbi:carbonic anhydrase [Sphingomicrobium aestuariivivum]|uniref:carbonic anhydrase n=1 Tax=Sphingomicrobium aestuariivivum TaxID=1582356 RepID=UPI001FD69A40|nr:carbonic anhydrase family protein [Sphingomicrobium aestuariivivum]MCJ8190855.1 carbonic anhydrase family protein [Sphingomicrobium aestuariivivum]